MKHWWNRSKAEQGRLRAWARTASEREREDLVASARAANEAAERERLRKKAALCLCEGRGTVGMRRPLNNGQHEIVSCPCPRCRSKDHVAWAVADQAARRAALGQPAPA